MRPINKATITILAFVFAAHAGAADSEEEGQKTKHHRKAPPAALEACSSLVAGDPCSFTGRRDEEIEGSCFAPPAKTLACRPDTPPPRLLREQTEEEDK